MSAAIAFWPSPEPSATATSTAIGFIFDASATLEEPGGRGSRGRLHQEDPKDTGGRVEAGPQTDERIQVKGSTMKGSTMKKSPRNIEDLTTLDDFLDSEGTREAFQAVAIKEVLSWQIMEAMKAQGLSRKRLAERMGTSRSQVSRLLDPKDGNVTLLTLQRAAELLGRKVRLELVHGDLLDATTPYI
jgi:antitoxin HicB